MVFDNDGSYILDKQSGEHINVLHERGKFLMDLTPTSPTSSSSRGSGRRSANTKWCMPVIVESSANQDELDALHGGEGADFDFVGDEEALAHEIEEAVAQSILEPEQLQADPVPQQVKVPKAPTPEEFHQHAVTHLPFAPWCEVCIAGRAQEDPHRERDPLDRQNPILGEPPVIQFDYGYAKSDDDARLLTVLYCWDASGSGSGASTVVERKEEMSFLFDGPLDSFRACTMLKFNFKVMVSIPLWHCFLRLLLEFLELVFEKPLYTVIKVMESRTM